MVIMGIDGSTSCSGYSVFVDNKLVDFGAIKPPNGLEWRSRIMWESLKFIDIIRKYKPTVVYMEDVPLKDGKQTIVKLGAVQGMLLGICAAFHIQVNFLLPSHWRGVLDLYDGTRDGTKREILKKKAIEMANETFGLNLLWVKDGSKKNEDDIAEAILIAYSQIKNK